MSLTISLGPSPKRKSFLAARDSMYIVELARKIADDCPSFQVLAQYGHHETEVIVIGGLSDDIELF
ncbi:hypothetical protein [Magnetospirillum sp. SS-4]|uniref:hypothetical protein n=1 Tax=Magnetospirillum sp. SS-4 TaxID=2681465 RepID=UPI0013829BDC|nr:hypothetical protein [Magnetospirillum sp. SS-4]CAA7627122.1 conserved hypothetical protein [Magnetospirillum sp. SS-4]